MKVTGTMKVKDVLQLNPAMLDAFTWLAPEFERLRSPALRKVMANRITVEQAGRVAKLPLSEVLYVLNLAAGEDTAALQAEMEGLPTTAFRTPPQDPSKRPDQLAGLGDDNPRVRKLDLMPLAERKEDPLPSIMRGLRLLNVEQDVLLLAHPFDPIPLRDLLARRGYASWAEERQPDRWSIYFYRPSEFAEAVAHPPLTVAMFVRAVAGFA
jgi:hypothetical protein